jgi:hypothetical protein
MDLKEVALNNINYTEMTNELIRGCVLATLPFDF